MLSTDWLRAAQRPSAIGVVRRRGCPKRRNSTQLNSTQLDVELSWVELSCVAINGALQAAWQAGDAAFCDLVVSRNISTCGSVFALLLSYTRRRFRFYIINNIKAYVHSENILYLQINCNEKPLNLGESRRDGILLLSLRSITCETMLRWII